MKNNDNKKNAYDYIDIAGNVIKTVVAWLVVLVVGFFAGKGKGDGKA